MKIHIILKIARQVEGEYVFANVVKASTDLGSLMQFMMENELPKTEVIKDAQNADIPCVIEYGVLRDVEVD